jgi:hypothetical protein
MANQVENIKIEPCDATWEIEEKWVVRVHGAAGTPALNNKWFKMYLPNGTWKHVWFNVNSGGTDPAPSGSAGGIPVALATNALSGAVATAMAAAIDADAGWLATADGDDVTITNAAVGQVTSMVDGTAATGFRFTQLQDGGSLELGYLDGDIEVTFEEQTLDVTAHQTGTTVLTGLRQGLVNEISLTMKEADMDKYKEFMLGTAGATDTPSGGTEVFGWGTASLGQNVIVKARRLVLHPVAQGADKSRDLCFWKAYALPDTLTISGENPKTLGLSFKVYRDDAKPSHINQFVFGDWSQSEYVP